MDQEEKEEGKKKVTNGIINTRKARLKRLSRRGKKWTKNKKGVIDRGQEEQEEEKIKRTSEGTIDKQGAIEKALEEEKEE